MTQNYDNMAADNNLFKPHGATEYPVPDLGWRSCTLGWMAKADPITQRIKFKLITNLFVLHSALVKKTYIHTIPATARPYIRNVKNKSIPAHTLEPVSSIRSTQSLFHVCAKSTRSASCIRMNRNPPTKPVYKHTETKRQVLSKLQTVASGRFKTVLLCAEVSLENKEMKKTSYRRLWNLTTK